MSIKTLTATGTLPNGTDQSVTLTVLQASIDDLIDDDTLMAVNMLIDGDEAKISLTKVIVKKVKNDTDVVEVLRVDPAAPCPLAKFNTRLGPEGDGIPNPKSYLTRHGLKVEITGDNSDAGGLPITVVFGVENQGKPASLPDAALKNAPANALDNFQKAGDSTKIP